MLVVLSKASTASTSSFKPPQPVETWAGAGGQHKRGRIHKRRHGHSGEPDSQSKTECGQAVWRDDGVNATAWAATTTRHIPTRALDLYSNVRTWWHTQALESHAALVLSQVSVPV